MVTKLMLLLNSCWVNGSGSKYALADTIQAESGMVKKRRKKQFLSPTPEDDLFLLWFLNQVTFSYFWLDTCVLLSSPYVNILSL